MGNWLTTVVGLRWPHVEALESVLYNAQQDRDQLRREQSKRGLLSERRSHPADNRVDLCHRGCRQGAAPVLSHEKIELCI